MTELKNTGFAGLIAIVMMTAFLSYGATNVPASAGAVKGVAQAPVFSVAEAMFLPDTTKPDPNAPLKIACPEDVSTYTDINECEADISYGLRLEVLAGTLASLSWVMSGATDDASPRNGINQLDNYVFNEGTTLVAYTASDKRGNVQSCSFTVIVSDNQVPKFTSVPENITVNADDAECGTHVSWDEPTFEDNCAPLFQIIKNTTHQSGAFFPIGTTRVTYTLDDGMAYNLNSYTFTVTVTDFVKPELTAPRNITVNCGEKLPPICATLQDWLDAGGTAHDNCALAASGFKFLGQSQNGSVCPYTVTRTYQIADNAGNITTTEQTIRVNSEDQEPEPEIVAEPIQPETKSLKSGMGIEAETQDYTTPGTYTFTVPAGVTSISVEAWGSGAGGDNSIDRGGGGGAYAANYSITVTPGATYTVVVGEGAAVGTGDDGENSSFGNIVIAAGAIGANGGTVAASAGAVRYAGGNGGTSTGRGGAGGGGSAGGGGNGGNGGNTNNDTGGAAGAAGAAGAGTAGAAGGAGGNRFGSGVTGSSPGGGGGERGESGGSSGGGGDGRVLITWDTPAGYCSGNAISQTNSGVSNADNARFAADGNAAVLSGTDWIVLDLINTGYLLTSSGNVAITWRVTDNWGSDYADVTVQFSADGTTWNPSSNATTHTITNTSYNDVNVTFNVDTRYIRIRRNSGSRDVYLDAVSFYTPCKPPCTQPQGTLTANGPFCATGAGQLTWTATAGTGPYTVVYNDGTANRTANNVVSGTAFATFTTPVTSTTNYTLVSVTAGDGCIRSSGFTDGTATVTVYPLPTITTTGTISTLCYSSSAQTATLPYTATTNSPTSYSIDWDAAANAAGLADQPSTPVTFTPGAGNINNIAITGGTSAGAYSGTMTITNNNGCTATKAVTININPLPTITLDPANASTCLGSTGANLYYSALSNSPSQYSVDYDAAAQAAGFSDRTNAPLSASPIVLIVPVGATTGTYNATLTVRNITTLCVSEVSNITVTVNPRPTITPGPNPSVCQGTTSADLTYTATTESPDQYSINFNAAAEGQGFADVTNAVLTASPITITVPGGAAPGTYTGSLTVTNSTTGCTSLASSISVIVNPLPVMTSAGTKTICSGANVSHALTSNIPSSYSWVATDNANVTGESTTSQSGSTISDVLVNTTTSVQTVTYTVTPTSTTGNCIGTSQTVTITVNPAPTMSNANSKTICSGDNVNLALTSVVPSSYSWVATDNVNVTGESTTPQSGSNINNVLVNTTTSVQTVTYTVTPTSTTGSCVGTSQTVTITVNPAPTMSNANTKAICSGDNVNLALTSVVPSSYSWVATANANVTGESTTAQSSATISDVLVNTTASVQTVTYTVTPTSTTGTCIGTSQTVTITVNPAPTMSNANTKTICSGENINLALTSVVPSSYSWVAADHANVTGESTTSQSGSTISDVLVNTTTSVQTVTYTVTPTSTTGNCIGISQTVTITVNPAPTMTSANTKTICSGTNVSHALTSNLLSSYSWVATANANVTGESTTAQSSATISDVLVNTTASVQTVTYTVTPTSTTGSCIGTSQTVTITVNPAPTMTSANAKTICTGTTVSLVLTSDIAAGYTWVATDNPNVTGESTTAQNTALISDNLVNPTSSAQTVIYTVTPTSTPSGCTGASQTVTITVTPVNTITLTSAAGTDNQTYCINTSITTITYSTAGATGATITGLPAGVTGNWNANTVTISGTPTVSGSFAFNIELTGGCGTVNKPGFITVTADNTVSAASSTPTVCINNALPAAITHTTTGATGIGVAAGLPAGVTASFAFNTLTINGTPTASGTFNYSVPLTGGCNSLNATGTITVTPDNTVTAASSTPSVCINTAIPDVTHTTTGATGIGTPTGLPAGVSASWASNTLTISGTPSASGTFNYSIPLTGGCGSVNATGTITVSADNTVSVASSTPTLCINTLLPVITHSTTGATGIGAATGLPAGVSASWAGNTITISGTPTVSGTFSYTIPLTGGCNVVNATGTITVTPDNTVSAASSSPTVCINNALSTAITHTTTGATGIGVPTGLPAGITATFASNTITISGTPTASGTFNYSIPLTGGCNTLFATGTIDVTPTVGIPTAITVSAGTEPACQLTTGTTTTTYSTTASDNTGFNWSISNPAAGSINPTTGVMTWNNGFTGTVDIQVRATGCNGPSVQVVRTVNVSPTVGTPTEPTPSATTICQGSSPTTYTTSATDATSYNWSVTGTGNTISGTGTTATVSWDPAFAGVATVSVTANGCNGPSASASTTVTVRPTPTVTIDGTTSVCQNTASPDVTFINPMALPVTVAYTIDGVAGPTINIGANSSATVAVSTATVHSYVYGLVSVQYQTAPDCSNSISGTATVTVRPEAPVQPGAITGNTLVLPASAGNVYSISPVANATTYTWSVPAGWNIVSGQGTTSVTVTSGVAGQNGNISVTAGNDCGSSTASTLAVTVDANLAIVTHPANQSDCYYNTVLFEVGISGGGGSITYTWQRNTGSGWVNISGDPDITYPTNGSMLVADIGSNENPGGTQYRVVVTDAGGTSVTSNPATLTVNRVLTMTGSLSTSICEGQSVTYTATTEGESPISFQWERDGVPVPGATGLTITINNATLADEGKYRLAVVFPMTTPNNNGGNPATCTKTSSLYRDLFVNPLPALSGPSEVCTGQTITWTANKTGTWVSNNPAVATIHATTGVVTGITAGTATFTFTENETTTTCSATTTPVTVHPLPTGTIALSGDAEICAGESSALSVTLTGTAPWSITYTDGTTPVTINAINSSPYIVTVNPATTSTYTLTAVNDVHCDATSLTGNATITVHPLPTATISGTTTICVGSSADLSVTLTGSQPWSITYTDGVTPVTVTGITSSPYLLPVSPATTTTYTLTAVSDAHCTGTSFTGSAIVNVDQLPTAGAGGSQTICSNGTATVSGATATGGFILWSHSGSGTLSDATTLTPTYNAVAGDAGKTVTLTLTVTSNTTCTTAPPATAAYTVNVDPLPTAAAGGSQAICPGATATVSGATATNGNILWSHNGSGTLADATTLTPTYTAGATDAGTTVTLTMTVTSNNACTPQTATASFAVNVNPEPQVNQPGNQEMCTGTSTNMINFTTTNTVGTTTYSWTNSEPLIGLAASGTGNIIPFTTTNSGNQPLVATITVTPHMTYNGVTCDGPAKTFTITVNPVPVAVAPIGLTYCNGILSDSYPLTGTPAGVLFDISGGAAIGLANVNGVSAIPAFTPIAGTATLTVIPKVNGCTGLPVSFNVTVRPTPTATIAGGATVCQNSAPPNIIISNPMNLTVTVTYDINGSGSYTVNIPANSNVSVAVPTNNAGTFHYNLNSVQYLNSEPPICSTTITGTATVEVVALPVPVLTGPTNICAETTGNVYTTEAGMTNYTWTVSAGGTITGGGGAGDNTVTVTWNTGGARNVSVSYTNSNGCTAFAPTVFPVNVYALPEPTITGSTSACLGSTNKVYSTQPGMTNYQWAVSAGGTITAGGTATSSSVTVTWTTLGPQTISVNYTNTNGCSANAAIVKNITVTPLPVPTIAGPDIVCAGSTGNVYTTEAGMSSYVWTVSAGGTITAGGTSNSNTATIRWNTDGARTVSVSYTNSEGCAPATPTMFPVTVNPRPVPVITGPTSVCNGSAGNIYRTEPGMTGYDWTIAAGGTITAGGDGIDSVVVTWTTTGAKTVRVNYANANGCTAASPTTLNVTVNALPAPAIAGLANACVGNSVTYTTVTGMTNYSWQVSAGGTITSGGSTTDHEVTVTWNTAGAQSVQLNYTNANGCSAINPGIRNVTVNAEPTPTFVSPALNGCTGAAGVVYTTQSGMTGYSWSVTGGTITAGGSGTDHTATVVWNTTGVQTISVNYYNANGCTATTPATASVNVVDPTPPTCPDDQIVCSNTPFFNLTGGLPTGGVYSGPGVTFVSGNYRFTPATAGVGTHTITYTRNTVCAETCTFTITVNPVPTFTATSVTICSGDTATIVLTPSVPGTTFTWTAANTAGTVTGFSNCSGTCDEVIKQVLTNSSVRYPGSAAGTNGVVTYTVTATKDGCTSTSTVTATVRPDIRSYSLTWNSNFVEDYIEVCAGAQALSDNDLEILLPNGSLVGSGHFSSGGNWNPTILYGPSLDGPWTLAAGSWHGAYEWYVDLDINNQLGYHYFVLQITDPVTGCVKYSNPAILNVVSSVTVEAGDPIFMCGSAATSLAGAYVGGIVSSGSPQGRWSITSLNPANGGNNGTLSSTALTTNPAGVTYSPPAGYVGTVTLTLTTNDPDGGGTCVPITDTRTITIAPSNSFNGCLDLANWPLSGTNSNGSRDDSGEPCLVTLVGSDNLSGTPGTTDITKCTGTGSLSFNWSFYAPKNQIIWHQEDQKVGSNSGNSIMQVAKPSNLAVGDLIIVTIHENANSGNITNGDGFTLIRRDFYNASSQITVASFYKIAVAADVARVTPYQFTIANNNASGDDRIYSSRVTGHNNTTPIGNSNGTNLYITPPAVEGFMSITIPSVNTTVANSMVVTALAIEIAGSSGNDVEYINAPMGTTTMYYNDVETTARVSQMIKTGAGATGGLTYQWPSYNTRNRYNMYAAAQQFIINPANNETDAAYYLLNGVPTLLGNTNGASGSKTITVNSSDVIGFRVGTSTNTGGPGKLIVYNLTMPNDAPVVTGVDTINVPGCQDDTYVPVFTVPTVTDDCDTPVAIKDSLGTVVIYGCERSQTRTWVYEDNCGAVSLPFEQVINWYVSSPLTVSAPIDPNLPACTDTALIRTAYDIWKAGFTVNGGCDVTTNINNIPPLVLTNIACGDTLSFEFIAVDACGNTDSKSMTFTVQPLTTLEVTCPADPNLPACSDSTTIANAYDAWKAGFSFNGGCAGVTDNMVDFPALTDLTCGGQLEFIYMVENSCGQSHSCYSSFTVAPFTELTITVPAGVSLPLCSDTTDIRTAYNAWKAGFTTNGGCDVTTNISSFPALGDLACGGSLSFVFTAWNGLDSCANVVTDSSTFTVSEAPELTIACPADPNIAGCLGIQAITDAYDTWVDGFKVFGGCNVSTNIDEIPPLGGLVCNGQLTFTFKAVNGEGVCADTVECTSTFTIGAAEILTVVVPANDTITGCNTSQAVIDAFNAWKAQFTYSGGCNVTTSDLSVYALPNSCGGTVTVPFTATDNCGQIVTDSSSFTLNPEILTVSCPTDRVEPACQSQAAIDAAFAEWKAQFTYTGGCGTIATDLSAINPPNTCGGTIIVNYSATDACGQVSNCSAIFTIDAPSNVLQEPSFTVPADITIYKDADCNYNADTTLTGVATDLTDNCTSAGNLTMSYADSIVAGNCNGEIIIYRTWTVADNCLNTTEKVQIITIADNTPPVVTCAPDVSGVADNGECDAVSVDIGTTTATDNCVLASLVGVRSDGLAVNDPYPVGVTTITWTATDGCGNSASCEQKVTMIDGVTQPPVITCPGNIVQSASANLCYLEDVVIPNPTATDNCEVATITWVMTGATNRVSPAGGMNYVGGETFNVGLTTVTYTATDSAGNFATCSFTVTILDVTPPVIDINSCADISDVAALNNCSKVPGTLNDPSYFDSCWPNDSLVLRWTMTGATTGSGFGTVTDSAFNVGVTTVTYYVTDPDGNEDNCNFDVTILDVTPPEIDINSCVDVSDVADPDNCSKIPATLQEPLYTDNCYPLDSLVLTYKITGATSGSGSGTLTGISFNVGVSTVSYYVSDPDGNVDSCSFTVTILDVTPPVINIANCVDVADVADPNRCSKVSAKLIDPEYNDTCWPLGSLTLTWTMTGATTGSGSGTVTDSAFNVGVTTVTYIVADPDGNRDTCEFTVTIVDVTPPVVGIEGCEDVTDITDDNNCEVVPGEIKDPVYNDTCWPVDSLTITWTMTGATSGSGTGSVKGQTFSAGITTVTYIVSDPDNNRDTCSFTVTIIPYNPPQFQAGCPPNVTSTADADSCGARLVIPDPIIEDPCFVGYKVTNNFNGTANASGFYPVGTTEVIWTIAPTVGDTTTCIQLVTVTDDEDPVIATCPPAINIEGCDTSVPLTPVFSTSIAGSTYAEFNVTNGGAATDNCVIDSVHYIDVAVGTCPTVITRTWTVFDAAGNSASCDQTITIGETTPPVVVCPVNDTIPSDFNLPYAEYSLPYFPYSDNCTDSALIVVTWEVTGVTTDSGNGLIPRPFRFNRGLNTITHTFTDACGNTSTCTFTLFVLRPPDIDCLPPKTYSTDAGVCTHRLPTSPPDEPGVPANNTGETLDWEYTIFNPDGTTGDTGSSTGATASPIDPYDFWLGTSVIRWVATNSSGTDTCEQQITVVDSIPPTFDAPTRELCVEPLYSAVYTGDADNLDYDPDYPEADYYIFEIGNDTLDINLATYADNCCTLADAFSIRWLIEFEGNDVTEPDIVGTGQPSTYVDGVTGNPINILLWGDGVNFQERIHHITYWITDCNGNESAPVVREIIVKPRPQLIKVP